MVLLSAGLSGALALGLTWLGYQKAAEVAKKAIAQGKAIKEVVVEQDLLSEAEASTILDPRRLTTPTRLK